MRSKPVGGNLTSRGVTLGTLGCHLHSGLMLDMNVGAFYCSFGFLEAKNRIM